MKIVFLDRKSLGQDLDLSAFDGLGEVVMYDFSAPEEIPERVRDADIIILNKALINEQTVGLAEKLKLVCVTATGTNNLDKAYLENRGIQWRNVAGYSTDSVAQHTFAMFFYLYEKLAYYDAYVKEGRYTEDRLFTHFGRVFHELAGKTWGVVGLGDIGKNVYDIAAAFGCRCHYYSTSGVHEEPGYVRVDWETLLAESDVISIHAPLNDSTYHLMNSRAFQKMKSSAVLINVGRGAIIVEEDLAWALREHEIAAAGIDVLDEEPMSRDNPLREFTDSTRILITPHIAWASVEARQRLMDIIYGQIREFFSGRESGCP